MKLSSIRIVGTSFFFGILLSSQALLGATTSWTSLEWGSLTGEQIVAIKSVIFPLGSIEHHGPHLPLGTDLLLAHAISMHASSGISNIAVLPVSPFGASFEHSSLTGTLAIQDFTLNAMWEDIMTSLQRSGIRSIICINAHGGQTPNVEMLIRSARFRHNISAVAINLQQMMFEEYHSFDPSGADAEKDRGGIHGGLIETSVMLHLHSDLVQTDKISNFRKNWRKSPAGMEPHGSAVSYGWKSEDLFHNGAVGDASGSSAETGKKIVVAVSNRIRQIVLELEGRADRASPNSFCYD